MLFTDIYCYLFKYKYLIYSFYDNNIASHSYYGIAYLVAFNPVYDHFKMYTEVVL